MIYTAAITSDSTVSIEQRGEESIITIDPGNQAIFPTGIWEGQPTLFRLADDLILRIEASTGQRFILIRAGMITLLSLPPSLARAEVLPLSVAAAQMPISAATTALPPLNDMPGAAPIVAATELPAAPSLARTPDLPAMTLPPTSLPPIADAAAGQPVRSALIMRVLRMFDPRYTIVTLFFALLIFGNTILATFKGSSQAIGWATTFVTCWWLLETWRRLPLLYSRANPLLEKAIGRSRSHRRRLVLAIGGGLLFFIFVMLPCVGLSTLATIVGPARSMSANYDIPIYLILSILIVYFLAGYVQFWRPTGATAHYLIDNIGNRGADVYAYVQERMAARDIPAPYTAEIVEITEQGMFSFLEYRTVRHMQIINDRARIILRVTPHGRDLFVSWDSYIDFSMRRYTYIFTLVNGMITSLMSRFAGFNLFAAFAQLFSQDRATGAQSTGMSSGPMPAGSLLMSLNLNTIPSYTIDTIVALEDSVTRTVEEYLNFLIVETGRQERIQMTVDRSAGRLNRLF